LRFTCARSTATPPARRDYLDAAEKLRDADYLFVAAGAKPRPD
jgi:hypothetical protein